MHVKSDASFQCLKMREQAVTKIVLNIVLLVAVFGQNCSEVFPNTSESLNGVGESRLFRQRLVLDGIFISNRLTNLGSQLMILLLSAGTGVIM